VGFPVITHQSTHFHQSVNDTPKAWVLYITAGLAGNIGETFRELRMGKDNDEMLYLGV
jgi:hypothetical protein